MFIVLNMTKSCQKKRIEARHGGKANEGIERMLTKIFDIYEPAGEDEEGARNITVTEDMSVDDVMHLVMETIAKI